MRKVVIRNKDTKEVTDRYDNVIEMTESSIKYQAGKGTMFINLPPESEAVDESEVDPNLN